MPHVSLRYCHCLAGLLAASLELFAGEHRGWFASAARQFQVRRWSSAATAEGQWL